MYIKPISLKPSINLNCLTDRIFFCIFPTRYGEIKSTKAIIEKQTGKCKGYGFVDFKRPADAQHALAEMKSEQKDVQLAKQREQDPTNLYFANLPTDVDEKCLTELLQKKFSATVNSTRIMRERIGNSKGVGFARVEFKETCEKIIKELNGKSFPGELFFKDRFCKSEIRYCFSLPKSENFFC